MRGRSVGACDDTVMRFARNYARDCAQKEILRLWDMLQHRQDDIACTIIKLIKIVRVIFGIIFWQIDSVKKTAIATARAFVSFVCPIDGKGWNHQIIGNMNIACINAK